MDQTQLIGAAIVCTVVTGLCGLICWLRWQSLPQPAPLVAIVVHEPQAGWPPPAFGEAQLFISRVIARKTVEEASQLPGGVSGIIADYVV
jgi:hypothetical protein